MYLLLALCVLLITFVLQGRFRKHQGTLSGKTLLITGCDTGFGRLMALRYCEEGAHVFAGCLTKEGSERLAAEVTGKGRLTTLPLDVTNETEIQAAYDVVRSTLEKEQNSLYAVVNNAGIFAGWYVEMTEMSEFERVMDINFLGSVRVTKKFLPLLHQTGGRIIVITSCATIIPAPSFSAYAASKCAQDAFFSCLRRELAFSGIRVVKIIPGFFNTRILESADRRPTVKQRWDRATSDVRKRYPRNLFLSVESRKDYILRIAGDPARVVRSVRDGLLCRHPATRIHVGFDALWFYWPLSFLPESCLDALSRVSQWGYL